MDIFSVIALIGGLTFFLYGMHVMSAALEKMAGGKVERTLRRMTSRPIAGLALGAGVTMVIQSSSALTVMLVGLVNSGIMEFPNTVGLIMGTNIGTTFTAWLTSMVGIQGDALWLKLIKPENFSLVFAFIGVFVMMMSKNARKKDIAEIFIGFALLMYGMKIMSSAMKPLEDIPAFTNMLTAFENPVLGVLVGMIFTAIIQSSSASVAILQALSMTGTIAWGVALPIIMGQNIGTCVTALLSSIGVSRSAKRVAIVHITFNIIGTTVFLTVFYLLHSIFHFPFADWIISPIEIAIAHSVFNLSTTVVLFPFAGKLVWIANKILPDHPTGQAFAFLDERLLNTPSVAVSECVNLTCTMAEKAEESFRGALELLNQYKEDQAQRVLSLEDELDRFEDNLGSYLVKISSKELSTEDSRMVSLLLHTIGDFERMGDHAVNILRSAQEIHEKQLSFSDEAKKEISTLSMAVVEIVHNAIVSFCQNDISLASKVEPLEQVVDYLTDLIKARHVERLRNACCTIEMGFVLSDLLGNFERVSDHCSNIAIAVIELEHDSFDTHEHLGMIKSLQDESFRREYDAYMTKYAV